VDGAAGTAPYRGSVFYTSPMVWEFVFMMVILKIPIVYLSLVVYWAVKAEPKPPETALLPAVVPEPREPWRPRIRAPRHGPHGAPNRRVARSPSPAARS
jgi:hypothetical protein